MEVNGRFWGSIALAIASGVDFPHLLYKMAVEGDVKPVFNYKVGVKCRWLIPGDILHLLASLKSRPDKMKTIRNFFSFFENQHYDELSLDDPLPALGMTFVSLKYFSDYLLGKRTISGEYR
jgi:predicted ATP-grasp superfamily ATP-dependent carboligase